MKKLFALFVLLAALGAQQAFAQNAIRVDGSTTVLPIMQKMVEAYMKENAGVNITVSGGGSGNGIKAIMDGTTDLAMSSREVKPNEMEAAKAKGRNLVVTAIAVDALLPIINPQNPVNDLKIEQLRAIFGGKITNWKEVGGDDKPIAVISRDSSSGTYEAWQEMVMKDTKPFPGALLQASSGAVLQVVSKNRFAIGYDSYGYLNSSVKGTKVEGIAGNPDTASNGTFPISRKLFVITNGEPAGELGKFMAFIMDPAKGQKIVGENGAVPVKK